MKIDAMDHAAQEDDDVTEPLPLEVRQAYLAVYSDTVLADRQRHYEREAIFERDKPTREALAHEAARTEQEINRRKMYERAEADRVFEL